MMKIVLAPDSFKGTLSAAEVCAIEARALRELLPDAQIIALPLADGGEGTIEAIEAACHQARKVAVGCHDPLMREISAAYLRLPDGTAVVEVAQASGLNRLAPSECNPLLANTFGTGEIIRHAQQDGSRRLIVGLGGSATVDGGLGLAAALGARFFDRSGQPLPPTTDSLDQIQTIERPSGLEEISLTIASDVNNPLLGSNGAAAVFGPQKGATPQMVDILEKRLRRWASLWHDEGNQPGDGAAGGLGFILRKLFPNCQTVSGGELVCRLAALERQLANAELVITGEGASDAQTLNGKLPMIVSRLANDASVPCALLSGYLPPAARYALDAYFLYLKGTIGKPPAPQDLTREACEKRLFQTTQDLIQTILDNS